MNRPLRILELRSVRGTGGGPEKTILLGAARTNSARFAVTVCYVRDRRDQVFGIDQRASHLALDYVELWERHSFDLAIWPALRALVKQRGCDIVHAHDYKTDALAWALGKAEPVIPMATAHGWTGNSARERMYYAADKRILARLPLVIAVSGDIRRQLVDAGADANRVHTVLNGIDHRAFRRQPEVVAAARADLGFEPRHFVIGAVGRLERQKRFDLLLEAFAALRSTHPHARLLIAGDGSLRESLVAAAERLGVSDDCRFVGHHSDVPRLHHALDVFVQASEYEGTSNAVLEAMALETPIVATDVGGTAELVHTGVHGLVVPSGRADVLAIALAAIIERPADARQRAVAARQRIEGDLSFERRMATVEAMYEQLVERSGKMSHVRTTRWVHPHGTP